MLNTLVALLKLWLVISSDNFSNSSLIVARVEKLAARKVISIEGDLTDLTPLEGFLETADLSTVIHFAAFKAVGESTCNLYDYYRK